MFEHRFVELLILILTIISSVFTIVNVFMDWVPDIYALAAMILFLLIDSLWRKYHDNKA